MRRTQVLFFILGGFFITNAVVAELIGGKIFSLPMPYFVQWFLSFFGIIRDQFHISVGLLPWPVVFVATDLVNEFFGRRGVRFYTFVTMGLILYVFVVLTLARQVGAASFSPVQDGAFDQIFGMSQWIIFGSVTAFALSQLIDVLVFTSVRRRTGSKHLWARATGSTIVSQLVDTFVIGGVAFYLPGFFTFTQYIEVTVVSYIFKVFVAIAITPMCYVGHAMIGAFLGEEEAKRLSEEAAQSSLRDYS